MKLTNIIFLGFLFQICFYESKQNDILNGLVNHWPIENHVDDIVGGANMYNGYNSFYTNDRFGTSNSAISLIDGYYQVPPGVYFRGDLTIALWIRLRVQVTWSKIIDFGNAAGLENVLVSASFGGSGFPAPQIFNVNNDQTLTSRTPLVIGAWTHLVFTLNGTLASFYMNGTLTAQSSMFVPNNVIRSPNYIGKSHWADDNLNADLDDLRFYNRSITLSEIFQLLNLAPIAPTFDFLQLGPAQTIELLNSNYDLSGCLVNCSNNGQCKFNSLINNFFCLCNSIYLSGYACQINTRPCSSNPCLNNATCVDYSNSANYNMSSLLSTNSSSFYCLCNQHYKGYFCELEIDVCQNETCSSNGNCFASNHMPKCKCFNMYSGDKCEFESSELKTVKAMISFTTILAIIIIVLFYCVFVLMDMAKYFCRRLNKGRHVHSYKRNVVKRFTYHNI